MRISCLFLFLFCFSVFAEYTVSYTYELHQKPGNDSWVATSLTLPANATSVMLTSDRSDGSVGLVRVSDNQIIDVSFATLMYEFASTFYVRQTGAWETGVTISWTVTISGDAPTDPENPDPENPDPENPDPENPDDDSDNKPWALEATLQSYMSNFQTFSQDFADWASALLGDVRAGNQTADAVLRVLTGINQQQINDHDQRALLHSDMKTFLGPVRDNVPGIKTGLDKLNTTAAGINTGIGDLNTKAGMSLTAQNLGNSYLASIDDNTGQIKDKTSSIDNKFSIANSHLTDIKSATQDIKNTLNPPVTSPTAPTPCSSLPSGSSFIQTVKSRLLPGYSFFTVSGDAWPSWTVTFSLSSFGMDDLTVVLGGSDWQTVAGGKIVWLASLIRTLSKFSFYLIFLNAVIRALRQW